MLCLRYPFLRSHLSSAVEENLRFVRFCKEWCERFHNNGDFDLHFCTETEQCERGIRVRYVPS